MSNLQSARTPITDELLSMAASARQIFVNLLKISGHTGKTEGSCQYATITTALMFNKFTYFECVARGGDGIQDGGYFDAAGAGHGHYWLEVDTPEGRYVVDITADQFGDAPVVIERAEGNTKYVPGNQQLVDEHLQEVVDSIPLPH